MFSSHRINYPPLNQLSSTPLLSRSLMGRVTEEGCGTMHHLPGIGAGSCHDESLGAHFQFLNFNIRELTSYCH